MHQAVPIIWLGDRKEHSSGSIKTAKAPPTKNVRSLEAAALDERGNTRHLDDSNREGWDPTPSHICRQVGLSCLQRPPVTFGVNRKCI